MKSGANSKKIKFTYEEMEENIRPKYNRMIESIEEFYRENKNLSKRRFIELIKTKENVKIYLPLLMRLYTGEDVDYKLFAMKNVKDLFNITNDINESMTVNEEEQ